MGLLMDCRTRAKAKAKGGVEGGGKERMMVDGWRSHTNTDTHTKAADKKQSLACAHLSDHSSSFGCAAESTWHMARRFFVNVQTTFRGKGQWLQLIHLLHSSDGLCAAHD